MSVTRAEDIAHLGTPRELNGFTETDDDIVPEFQVDGDIRMQEGAEVWEVLPHGTQRPEAVLRREGWIPVGPEVK